MTGTIDFHTHYIPRAVQDFRADGCTRLELESPSCGHLYNGLQHYRTIDDRSWDARRRLADMDSRGVSLQLLSPIPVTNSYETQPQHGLAFARIHNDGIAEVVRERPDRFAGLGAVPLQDVDAACAELDRLVNELGLHGVEIGTTVAGLELDDPHLTAFWEQCNARRSLVFIHPESAPAFDRLRAYGLITSAAYPSETGTVAARLIMSGLLERFADVRIILAHGGGTLPWRLPRLDRMWEMAPAVRAALPHRPSDAARSFYCDSLTFDAVNLQLVATRIGIEHIVVGSDYPFQIMEDPPGTVLAQADGFDDAARELLRNRNARRLLEWARARD